MGSGNTHTQDEVRVDTVRSQNILNLALLAKHGQKESIFFSMTEKDLLLPSRDSPEITLNLMADFYSDCHGNKVCTDLCPPDMHQGPALIY